MSKISPSLLSLIGETPLVEIKNIDTGLCQLYVKMESHNPGGSIKDRTASYIINQAEKDGLLKPLGLEFKIFKRNLLGCISNHSRAVDASIKG